MKILYIATARIPTEKAHGVQIMHMCAAFAALGHAVELVVPRRRNPITADPFEYYNVPRTFSITYLPAPDTVASGKAGFLFHQFVFGWRVRRYVRRGERDVLYSRDEVPLWMTGKSRALKIYETHQGFWNFIARAVLRRADRVVAITNGLKTFLVEKGIAPEKIIVAPDAIDLSQFQHPQSRDAARARLGMPRGVKIAMYVGRLDGWKGVATFCKAAELFPSDAQAVVIGGEEQQLQECKQRYPNVTFLGFRPYRELADNQAAADVLVLPNTGTDATSARFTSPLKLFSYMASGVPIVASDLPSIREVLDERMAFFFRSDDATSCARAIISACSDPTTALAKAKAAQEAVKNYTWTARALHIVESLSPQDESRRS